jgi:hypothetical protein
MFFNLLKQHFHHQQNVYSYKHLLKVLQGEHMTILRTEDGNFFKEWDAFLDCFYNRIPAGKIQINHNFSVEHQGAPTVMKFSVVEGEVVSEYDYKI